jgi:TadE-like protein
MRLAARNERGSMAVEVVVLIPVLFMFTLFVVAGGRYVSARADADSTARDAARAASQAHTRGEAEDAVQQAIRDGLRSTRDCQPTHLSGDFVSGGTAIVHLSCQVHYKDLGLLGIPGAIPVEAEGHAPIDTYRSTR